MARRTPPVAIQVIPPFRPSNALLQKRLIDFDTGSATLENQHKAWLTEAMNRAKGNSAFHVRIFGFASRLGDENANEKLSLARMNAVYNFIKAIDGRVLNSIEMWHAAGSSESGGTAKDDSPEWRAVEVHIFIGEIPPPPPPPGNKKVDPPSKPPLPGGQRFGRWSVSAPGGGTATIGPSIGPLTAGVAVGFNVFYVKNEDTQEIRKYWSPVGGLGVSLGIPSNFKSLSNLIQTLATSPSYSAISFTKVFPPHAVTWNEVEACLVSVQGAGAGAGKRNVSAAVVTFHGPGVYQYGPSGFPLRIAEDIWSFNSSSDLMLGVGANATAGPLFRL